ncbi:MAG TPA: superoxide dismutase family protein [Candidatus Nanopelagicales bacterium]|nr:superoxide dismutase family protein [Candidatus Nanopelagicales bacterium]
MTTTSRRALAVPAILALAGVCATAPAAADTRGPLVRASGVLSDLQVAAGPFDGASAAVQIVSSGRGSHTVLRVRGIHHADGQTFGAHLHAGPCVAGNGSAAQGHYNTDVIAEDPTPEISEDTEVWLDFTVDDGAGTATASVPFIPLAGDRSVVIHALATDHHSGLAGARLACLPVQW